MSTKIAFSAWAAVVLLLTTLAISESTALAAQICPPVGANNVLRNNPNPAVGLTYCGTVITIDDSGIRVDHTPGQGPYEGIDDTLVGIVNNSSKSIDRIGLGSGLPIFAFDSDGICDTLFLQSPRPTDCPSGSQTLFGTPYTLNGYEGLHVFRSGPGNLNKLLSGESATVDGPTGR